MKPDAPKGGGGISQDASAVIMDEPFDAAVWMGYGEPTYGGKRMKNPLPTKEEFFFMLRLSLGEDVLPGHDAAQIGGSS